METSKETAVGRGVPSAIAAFGVPAPALIVWLRHVG